MLKNLFIIVLFLLLVTTNSVSQEKEELQVEEMVLCTAVEERQPVGVDTVFSDTVEKVYCFTKVTGATDTVSVSHVWYFKNSEVAKVSLSVKSKTWRTWSSKNIVKEWDGKWRVDVLSSNGDVIKSKEFLITTSPY